MPQVSLEALARRRYTRATKCGTHPKNDPSLSALRGPSQRRALSSPTCLIEGRLRGENRRSEKNRTLDTEGCGTPIRLEVVDSAGLYEGTVAAQNGPTVILSDPKGPV